MKLKNFLASFVGFLFSFGVCAAAATPIITQVPVIGAYSPLGFDSNDNVEVMIEGYLPNLCYKSPMIKTEIKDFQVQITVEAFRASQKGIVCLEMIVPFVERVSLGLLEKGDYKILVNNKLATEVNVVKASSPFIDENIYANVSTIEKIEGARKILLKGYNPSDCLELDKIEIISNKVNVYSILPKMKKVSEFCPMKMIPFSYEVEIPSDLEAEKILLHVRAMDGRSVNALFNNFMDQLIDI